MPDSTSEGRRSFAFVAEPSPLRMAGTALAAMRG
jgi:hypothetical protein